MDLKEYIQQEMKEDLDKQFKEKEKSHYLYSLYNRGFIRLFWDKMRTAVPWTIADDKVLAIFGKHIKRVYEELVQKRNWAEKKFTIILWNVMWKDMNAFDVQSFFDLEYAYNNLILQLPPYNWSWEDDDILDTIDFDFEGEE